MTERTTKYPEQPKPFSAEITELNDGRILQYRLLGDSDDIAHTHDPTRRINVI